MADKAAASPSRFLVHTTPPVSQAVVSQAVAVAAIGKAWKRGREAASPAPRESAGGATAPFAPMAVAISSPPASRQRTVSFNLTGADIDA